MKLFSLCVLLISINCYAQEAVQSPEQNAPIIQPRSVFSSQLSAGYLPEVDQTSMSVSYWSRDSESSAKIVTTKFYDYNSNTSELDLSVKRRLSDKFLIGLSLSQTLSGSLVTKYSSAATASGFVDSNDSKSGLSEPKLNLEKILKETQESRIVGSVDFAIPMGSSKPGDAKAGGGSVGVDVDFYKSYGPTEIVFSFNYTAADKLKSEYASGTTGTTSGTGRFGLAGGANFYINQDTAFGLGIVRSQYASSTVSYSSGAQNLTIDANSTNGIFANLGFKFQEDVTISAAFYSYRNDATDVKQGTTTISVGEGTGRSMSVGVLAAF